MLLPIKPICPVSKKRRDGTSLIFIQYCAETPKLLNTEIAIPPQFWNKKTESVSSKLPTEYGDFSLFNEEIERQLKIATEIIKWVNKNGVTDKGQFVKKVFKPNFDVSTLDKLDLLGDPLSADNSDPLNIYYQIEQYCKDKKGTVSSETIAIYETMSDHLKAFEEFRGKPITFQCLDFDFYDRFTHFLTYTYQQPRFKEPIIGLKQNSISKDIKHLKGFVKDRAKRKIIAPINMEDFKSPEEDSDAIYLPFSEIAQIYNTDLSQFPELINDRNRLVLACLTGLRFSDFSTLEPEDVRDGRIYLKQEKSDGRVVIPLRREAEQILIELFKEGITYVSNSEFNKNIKLIGRLAGLNQPITFSYKKGITVNKVTRPKSDWITSHTGRRSFCTNEFLAGTPVKLIMLISGHKKEKDFYKYIKITQEEAAKILEKLWAEKNALQPLELYSTQIISA
ncbi:tyrosine-type recombinase/integrase [Chitinophaga niabensis]|uniref:Site-specific recombinase XerD n=1 Tax=Chitinophaga niabensis TaxID=536979 RepID=A0A1N6KAA3_9BACT|nr:phage integrase SAM-like domain-containing protein [Chitinophaga niabensis]SIO53461.1 Site-specific recombinase XerD [Chitinophaga niabensis]